MDATIQLTDDQRLLVEKALEMGFIARFEESLDVGLDELRRKVYHRLPFRKTNRQNLADFIRNSPWVGITLDLERNPDTGREIEL